MNSSRVEHIHIDGGAESSVAAEEACLKRNIHIKPSTQIVVQADGETPMKVKGEIEIKFVRNSISLPFKALVVEKTGRDCDFLAGRNFLKHNDITINHGSDTLTFNKTGQTFQCTDPYALFQTDRSLFKVARTETLLPGEYTTLSVPATTPPNATISIEGRSEIK